MKLFYAKYLLLICLANSYGIPISRRFPFAPVVIKPYTCSPLHTAVKTNNIPELKQLLVRPWAIDYKDSKGQTPLALAVSKKKHTIMEILLRAGASANIGCGTASFLYETVERKDAIGAQLLIMYGANVNAMNGSRDSSLHRAKTIETTELLLRAGSLVNHKSNAVETALFHQFHYGSLYEQFLKQCVLHLYYGADPNQKGIQYSHIGEEHIIKLARWRDCPFEAAVALMMWGAAPAGKVSEESIKLTKWAKERFREYGDRDMGKPQMKLLLDLFRCPQILGADSKKDLDPNLLKELDIADLSIEKICLAKKVVRREFLEIPRSRMYIRPAPAIGETIPQETTNIYLALSGKQAGIPAMFSHRKIVNSSITAIEVSDKRGRVDGGGQLIVKWPKR